MLVETSNDKTPSLDSLGTSLDVLSRDTSGNGHVSRNIRVALLAADVVEPYLTITSVNNLTLSTDILPLTGRNCKRMNAVKVPQTLSEVTVEWTVGGALEIDETQLYYGNWNSVSGVDCMAQPPSNLDQNLALGSMLTSTTGTGYFSKFGVSPTTVSLTADSPPLGPVFQATVDLSSFEVGDEIVVMAKAKVDQSWVQQPSDVAPQVAPQSHIVNARTNASWFHENNGKILQGREEWYSIIPLTLVISDTARLEDVSNTFGEDSVANDLVATTGTEGVTAGSDVVETTSAATIAMTTASHTTTTTAFSEGATRTEEVPAITTETPKVTTNIAAEATSQTQAVSTLQPASESFALITPKNYAGCMRIHGQGEDNDVVRLSTCNAADPNEQFKLDGNQIQLALDPNKCLQAGLGDSPTNGTYLRVAPCDRSSPLQQFAWDAPDGALTLINTNLVVVFRGTIANLNTDPIILRDASNESVAARKDWVIWN